LKRLFKYDVNSDCIECKLCSFLAEDNFEIVKKEGARIKQQPQNQMQQDFCEEAKEICPVDAIERV
jgi:ferredoxin